MNAPVPIISPAEPLSSGLKLPDFGERALLPLDDFLHSHALDQSRIEKIRLLRTELLMRHEHGERANMMAVLSPCAGEGRSQLAAALAIAFAQLGRPTLLIDADMRKPHQHLLFGADNDNGLSNALALVQRPLLQRVSGLPEMCVLTAGPLPSNALELLSDHRLEALVSEWRRNFAFVIFDTPPICQYADGLAIAAVVGRLLSLSRARHTPYRDTREMMRRLGATRSRILGAVINHF